jgi:hypothetical protein
MSEELKYDRRHFLCTAAMTVAASELFMIGSVNAQSSKKKDTDTTTIKRGTITSFGPLKQTDAGVLNVSYAEAGPVNGPAVILLHARSKFFSPNPTLARASIRTITDAIPRRY